ncbi:phosphoribosylanthranilate isomerase [Actinocrispum wychmicini]|uniref:N-(5'-phosphoribosyl)anthranilate isomerase n=1 Tax=Actinocrispum wychmicini TaxID=1213861 RepID=A0A4R2J354_9PSEU|nr:N-(5'-phosphoribosyl)anthranilate isomerase [Actinocrispum wychmicini]TCO52833.1 phosphoribosylanthranilate isomerase [Actinocrispum wychmicini]
MTKTLLKVCGAKTRRDVELLADSGADLVGLWHGVPNGPSEVSVDQVSLLAEAARATGQLEPMLVTFLSDVDLLREIVARTGIRWIQLHAYQMPQMIKALRRTVPDDVTIVKVLHLRAGTCLEKPLIKAYEKAGTDLFLLDVVTEDGQIGSTGQRLHPKAVVELVPSFTKPFLLAGGISAHNSADYATVAAHPQFLGIDVDTGARDHRGHFEGKNISAITRGWRTARHEEVA